MKIAFFDDQKFFRDFFDEENKFFHHDIHYFESRLTEQSSSLAYGYECVCVFVNDHLNKKTLEEIKRGGTKLVALRSAGFNNVDIKAATQLDLNVVRVPEYSPFAVAEHAVALILTLNRKIHKAFMRVREGNFSLNGLVGFDLHGKKIGVIGTGKIGKIFSKIMRGFDCDVLLFDINPDMEFAEKIGARYCHYEEIITTSDIISLHIPLTAETKHLINDSSIRMMKPGVMLVNTSRGGTVDTQALIKGLKSGRISYAALDVYEEEESIFFQDRSDQIQMDDIFVRLTNFPNVLVTGHQAFLTAEALKNIARITLQNIRDFENGEKLTNELRQL